MKRLLTPLHSLAALALDLTHAAFSALADQCRAVNHAIDAAVWADDEEHVPATYDEAYSHVVFDAAADFYQDVGMWDAKKFAAAMRAWKSMPCDERKPS